MLLRNRGVWFGVAVGLLLLICGVAVQGLPVAGKDTELSTQAMDIPLSPIPVSTHLPQGFKTAILDSSGEEIWILSRRDLDNHVLLSRLVLQTGTVTTQELSDAGQDWANGALAATADRVYAGWGDHLFSIRKSDATSESVKTPWADAGDGQTGRLVSMVATDSHVWVAVWGEMALRQFDVQTGEWSLATMTPAPIDGFVSLGVISGTAEVFTADARSLPGPHPGQQLVISDSAAQIIGDGVVETMPVAISDLTPPAVRPAAASDSMVAVVIRENSAIKIVALPRPTGSPSRALDLPLAKVERQNHITGTESTVALDPKVESIVLDASNNAWLITEYGDDAPYAAVMRVALT